MPHDILQRLGVHPLSRFLGAVCVAADMRRHLRHLHPIDPVKLVTDVFKIMLPVHGKHRPFIFIQEQKACVSVDHQATELGNAEPCIEQDVDSVIISAEMLISLHKFQKAALIFYQDDCGSDVIVSVLP